ncbi:MAG: hypothetical protein LBN95_07320 [Prevotellaceae bacterium]|jgi:hypothetical protein|nr:hypothetical protein [Prevotellaceae bacterium]
MARPIADTPILRGQDALRFMEAMENVKQVSKEKLESIEKSYQLFKSRATFPF